MASTAALRVAHDAPHPAPAIPVGRPPMDPPSRPGTALPAGSCDAHLHVFSGPAEQERLPDRREDPAPGTLSDWLARLRRQMAALGVERVVFVQSVVYGQDNATTLRAIEAMGRDRARGIGLVEPDVTPRELRALHEGGVRGIRLNFRHRGPLDLDALEAMAPRLADAGLHAQVLLASWEQADAYASRLEALPVTVVVDHFVGPEPDGGEGRFLDLFERGGVFVKLSASYRIEPAPHDALGPLVRRLARRPDRLVWGSDWPFVMHDGPIPDMGPTVDAIAAMLGPGALKDVFVRTPGRLYGFDPS